MAKKKHINVSWSRIREWMTCRWRYHFSYEKYLTSIKVSEPLYYGSAFHELLDYIYSGGKNSGNYKRTDTKLMRSKLQRMGFSAGEDLDKMMEYAEKYAGHIYRNPSQEPREVIATEFPFAVPLDIDRLVGAPYDSVSFIGIIDMIVSRRRSPEIWDHKLQSNHPRVGELDHPSISYPQMGLYSWASSKLGHFIQRAVLNVFGKRRKDNNVQRYPIKITKKESSMWEGWLYEIVSDMLSNPLRPKSIGSMYCGFCDYRHVCVKHQTQGEAGLSAALKLDFEKKSYDHRKGKIWAEEFPADVLIQLKEATR